MAKSSINTQSEFPISVEEIVESERYQTVMLAAEAVRGAWNQATEDTVLTDVDYFDLIRRNAIEHGLANSEDFEGDNVPEIMKEISAVIFGSDVVHISR